LRIWADSGNRLQITLTSRRLYVLSAGRRDYRVCKDSDDEKHVHPLQLDVIDRCVMLRSNPGENVFTPFMGVGSEVYSAVIADRKGIGVELKAGTGCNPRGFNPGG
jgi:DNA modification methylase